MLPLAEKNILCLEVAVQNTLTAQVERGDARQPMIGSAFLVDEHQQVRGGRRLLVGGGSLVIKACLWMYARAETSSQSQSMTCS